MKSKTILMTGLLAVAGGGWLHAESLSFNFTVGSTSNVSYGGSGGALAGTIAISSSVTAGSQTGSCTASVNGCALTFTTGALDGSNSAYPSLGSVGNAFVYSFTPNSPPASFQAVTGTSGTLKNPNSPTTLIGSNQTMAMGSMGTTSGTGIWTTGSPTTTLEFSAPVTAMGPANLQSILTAFGLNNVLPLNGTLTFDIAVSGHPNTTTGAFSGGQITAGSLSLNVSSVVPEPGSILLIGLGLIGIAFLGRKRLASSRS